MSEQNTLSGLKCTTTSYRHLFIHSYSAPRAKSPPNVRRREWKKVSFLWERKLVPKKRERKGFSTVGLDDAGFTTGAPLSVSLIRRCPSETAVRTSRRRVLPSFSHWPLALAGWTVGRGRGLAALSGNILYIVTSTVGGEESLQKAMN